MEVVTSLLGDSAHRSDATWTKNSHALRPLEARVASASLVVLSVAAAWACYIDSALLAPLPCDGGVLLDDKCWQLGAGGESCVDFCGSESAVDAGATVRGSGQAAVQAALTGHAGLGSNVDCGVDDRQFPYGGMTLLDESNAWVCVPADEGGGYRSVPTPRHRSPCVCTAPPVERPLVNATEGVAAAVVLLGVLLLLGAAVDAIGARDTSGEGGQANAGSCAALVAAVTARDFPMAIDHLANLLGGHTGELEVGKLGRFEKAGLLAGSAAVMLDFYLGARASSETPRSLASSTCPLTARPSGSVASLLFQMSLCSSSMRGMPCGASSSHPPLCSSSHARRAP